MRVRDCIMSQPPPDNNIGGIVSDARADAPAFQYSIGHSPARPVGEGLQRFIRPCLEYRQGADA